MRFIMKSSDHHRINPAVEYTWHRVSKLLKGVHLFKSSSQLLFSIKDGEEQRYSKSMKKTKSERDKEAEIHNHGNKGKSWASVFWGHTQKMQSKVADTKAKPNPLGHRTRPSKSKGTFSNRHQMIKYWNTYLLINTTAKKISLPWNAATCCTFV